MKKTRKKRERSIAELTRAARKLRSDMLRQMLDIDRKTWSVLLKTGPGDAHMHPVEWCRLMVLCAAGFGGVGAHIERAVAASAVAETLASEGEKPVFRANDAFPDDNDESPW